MRRQMFLGGNKRVAILFANIIMIQNGCGILSIIQENQFVFYKLQDYEAGNMENLKWI